MTGVAAFVRGPVAAMLRVLRGPFFVFFCRSREGCGSLRLHPRTGAAVQGFTLKPLNDPRVQGVQTKPFITQRVSVTRQKRGE